VGGIKTTLPFFREIVRDEEFIAGRLDTGFIARFQERRSGTGVSPVGTHAQDARATEQDMAIIAAALAYQRAQRKASPSHRSNEQSKWKLAGRKAGLSSMVGRKSPRRS
jgi:acetyl/propionyl-CoA carboxylase alpha subunit